MSENEEENKEENKEDKGDKNKETNTVPDSTLLINKANEALVEKANAAATRLENANKEHKDLLAREETLALNRTLGGKAEAGNNETEESPEEYAKKIMAGEIDGTEKEAK